LRKVVRHCCRWWVKEWWHDLARKALRYYARRESARVAGLGRAVSQAAYESANAEATGARLRRMAQDVQTGTGPMLAANLRASGLLATGLVEEAERQGQKAENAGNEAARLRLTMGLHDRRRLFGENAANSVRMAEAEDAEAREMAARPVVRRKW